MVGVLSCGIRVSLHYPLQDSDRMRKLMLEPLPGSFAFSYPQILRKSHPWYSRGGTRLDRDVQILAVIEDDFKRMQRNTLVG